MTRRKSFPAPSVPEVGPQEQDDAEILVVAGIKPVLETLEREPERVDRLFVKKGMRTPESMRMLDLCRSASIRFSLVSDAALHALCPRSHQGAVLRLSCSSGTEFSALLAGTRTARLPLILALDQVQDTGNVGALARSLYALGGAGLLMPRHNSAYAGSGAMRASAGTLRNLPISRVANLGRALEETRKAGITVYGAASDASGQNAWHVDFLTPALLVLGNEDKGLRPGVAKHCDTLLHIPMRSDADSLNVAQAGAMLLACFAKQTI